VAGYRWPAEKWIYPKIRATKLKDFKATDADQFFRDAATSLSKASLVKIKSTLTRSIQRAQRYDLIGRNVAELIDLPQGRPGRPSRAMSEEQAGKVLRTATGQATGYVKSVKVSHSQVAVTHAGAETGELPCGTRPRKQVSIIEIGTDLGVVTCRTCCAELGADGRASEGLRLEALFFVSITLGLRPRELRKLSWDHVDLDHGVIHVGTSPSGCTCPTGQSARICTASSPGSGSPAVASFPQPSPLAMIRSMDGAETVQLTPAAADQIKGMQFTASGRRPPEQRTQVRAH
jgi:integrase